MALIQEGNQLIITYQCTDFSSCPSTTLTLYPGSYKIECWGATGGRATFSNEQDQSKAIPGKGGYANGTLTIYSKIQAFAHIGGKGQWNPNKAMPGGNNGGGPGYYEERNENEFLDYPSGGGATDLRLIKDDLKNRLIVAGGGGSHGYYRRKTLETIMYIGAGGSGGGETAENGFDSSYGSYAGSGGTNLDGFKFGSGATRGGGGGWYGGELGLGGCGCGGGSGFVYHSKVSIKDGFNLPEKYMMKDTQLIRGSDEIPLVAPNFLRDENGVMKITILKIFDTLSDYLAQKKKYFISPTILFITLSINSFS